MKILKTASFLFVIMIAVAAFSLAGEAPIVNMVMPAPVVQAATINHDAQPVPADQQKSFDQAYQAMHQRMEVRTADCCPAPCPPICP